MGAIALEALKDAPVIPVSTPANLAKAKVDKELHEMIFGQTESTSTAAATMATIPATTDDLAAQIKARLKQGSLRCSDIAKEQGRSNADMKTWLEANGFTVAVPGWVKVR